MGFFSRLFGKKPETAKVQRRVAEVREHVEERRHDGTIRFDPGLIGKLKDDHQELFRLYGDLVASKDKGDFAAIPQLLQDFKLMLQTHLMVENVRFYVYLQQHFAADAEIAGFISDVRKEMETIARAAIRFVNTYSVPSYTPELKASFTQELSAIGNVLTKRVAMEESRLYTLYQQH
ncbi:MAG: hemerythrin domain-containing protein [Polaromonas sp.]